MVPIELFSDEQDSPNGYTARYDFGVGASTQFSVIITLGYSSVTGGIFAYNTSVVSLPYKPACCGDSDNLLGCWSPNSPGLCGDTYSYPSDPQFPVNFTVKWIHAPGFGLTYYEAAETGYSHRIHRRIPAIKALNCLFVIENPKPKSQ